MNKLIKASKQEMGDAEHAKEKMRKAGWQGTVDDMRIRADEMMGSKPKYIERERKDMERDNFKEKADAMRDRADRNTAASMRDEAYKKGGMATRKMAKPDCYAAGGVAKIRHKQSTASGKPMAAPRGRSRGC